MPPTTGVRSSGRTVMGPGGHPSGTSMDDMTRDMRDRFPVAALLSIPILLWSPIGREVLGFTAAAPFGLRDDVFSLVLSLPVIFYSAWIFFDGAYRALRNRTLDMIVLVAVGVGTGWLYSLGVTLTGGGEVFYEAAAVLTAFVLLGHWFEMRARGGANDAVRTLLELAPAMAVVLRDGEPVEVPTAEVQAGDVLLVRPGSRIPVALRIGQGTLRRMRQNLAWAIGYNAIAVPIAAGVFAPAFGLVLRPEIAALAMSGSSLIVALNALLLGRLTLPASPPETPTGTPRGPSRRLHRRVPGDRPFLLVPPLSSFSAEVRIGQTVTGFLDPTHLINTFGLIGIMAILFAECGLLVGFFLPGDSLLFTAGLLVAGGLVAPLWLLLIPLPLAAVAGNLVGWWIGRKAGPTVFDRPESRPFTARPPSPPGPSSSATAPGPSSSPGSSRW